MDDAYISIPGFISSDNKVNRGWIIRFSEPTDRIQFPLTTGSREIHDCELITQEVRNSSEYI